MKPSPDSQPLSYAQRPTTARRWRWRVVFGVLAVTIGLLAWARGPAVYDRAMLLYWQRQCMNYRAPADQVVYEGPGTKSEAELAPDEAVLSRFHGDGDPQAIGHVPKAVTEFFARAGLMPLHQQECVLFMHGLTSPNGMRQLVIVTCDESNTPAGHLESAVDAVVVAPGGWQGMPVFMSGMAAADWPHWKGPLPPLRVYAGQVDAKDPSYFTIRFKRIEEGLIEGRLTDDGKVHLRFLGSTSDGFDTPLEKP
jgi:hypothetical protein